MVTAAWGGALTLPSPTGFYRAQHHPSNHRDPQTPQGPHAAGCSPWHRGPLHGSRWQAGTDKGSLCCNLNKDMMNLMHWGRRLPCSLQPHLMGLCLITTSSTAILWPQDSLHVRMVLFSASFAFALFLISSLSLLQPEELLFLLGKEKDRRLSLV